MEVTTRSTPIRVQTLAQSNTSTVPPQYVQPPSHRPTTAAASTAAATIPTVDLSLPAAALLRDISLSCRDWGGFHVTNHGVPLSLLRRMRDVGSSFFDGLDLEEKLKYSCDGGGAASEGYGSRMLVRESDDVVLDWRDYFDHHTFPLSRRDPSRWPRYPPDYRQVVEEYSEQMKMLAQKLLALISQSLGLQPSCIEDAVGEFYQNITDDVGGLEVLKDGEWVNVEPLSDAIVVLLADQTEVITNGEYRSAIHRAVTNANRARLSVATFHDPAKTRKVSPAKELVAKSAPRYREVLYGDFVKSWYTKGPDGKRNLDALLL